MFFFCGQNIYLMSRSQISSSIRNLVSQYHQRPSGQSRDQFSSANNITVHQLSSWVTQVKKEDSQKLSPDFALVNLTDSKPSCKLPVTIHLPNGTTIEIPQ